MGAPQAGIGIKFTVTNGTASLSPTTATTNSSGLAATTASITNLSATVQVSACVTPGNNPCQTFTIFAVLPTSWTLEAVSGSAQIVPNGQPFQPLVMRVTDGSASDNPVQGVNVTFLTTLERNPQGGGGPPQGNIMRKGKPEDGQPIILGTSQSQVVTDPNGPAAITPTVGNLGPCDALITVSGGRGQLPNSTLKTWTRCHPRSNHRCQNRPSLTQCHSSLSWAKPVVAPQEPPIELFAIPQEMPAAEGPPAAEANSADPQPADPRTRDEVFEPEARRPRRVDPPNAPEGGKSCSSDLPSGRGNSSTSPPRASL